MTDTQVTTPRERILSAFNRWIAQRPGLEFGNYGDLANYRSELRTITKDLHDARALLAAVSWRESITAEVLAESCTRAYSGRLTWDSDKGALAYCTGQYWPTEYRKAVCAVLASALWEYWRKDLPAGDEHKADSIRAIAKRELGRSVAGRWFR